MSYYPINKKLQEKIVRKLEFNDSYNSEGLYPHQEFVRRYLSPHTPYRGLLIFHSLGSGKSLVCISTALDHYLYDKKRCLIVTKGTSGRENFKREIEHYYNMTKLCPKKYPDEPGRKISYRVFQKIFQLNHYMSLHNSICTMNDEDIKKEFSNMVFVFDEIHNIRSLGTRDGTVRDIPENFDDTHVYDSLRRIIGVAENIKIILATATPMTNDVGQLTSTMKLLTDKEGPYYGLVSYNSEIKDKPKKIFHGVKGYLKDTKIYLSNMIDHQKRYHAEEKAKGTPKDIYRTLIHISLFTFPDGLCGRKIFDQGVMVPSKTSKEIVLSRLKIRKRMTYTTNRVIDSYRKYLTGDMLRSCSSKYWELMDIIEKTAVGPIFVFAEEVRGSGLLLLANIFEEHGYELYIGQSLPTIGTGKRYTICVGDQSVTPNSEDRLHGFNDKKNIDGKYVRVLLGSKVVGESITLKNVRQFHVLTIHWNDSTIEQAVGRVVRSGSHNDLKEHERKVDIYVHAAVSGEDDGKVEGTDMYKLSICNKKQLIISEMEESLKEVAVDRYITQEKPSGKYIPSCDSSTFTLYYMEKYSKILISGLKTAFKELFNGRDSVPTKEILTLVDQTTSTTLAKLLVNPEVLTELLYKVVTNNIRILGKYLREDVDEFFLTDDPSLPFFFIRDRKIDVEDKIFSSRYYIPQYEKDIKIKDTMDSVEKICGMSFIERISFVEKYVETRMELGKSRLIPRIFDALFIKYHEKIYHIMCYRFPGEAYTAVLPIPKEKVLELRMRVLTDNGWTYIDDREKEIKIVRKLEERYETLMSKIDDDEIVFLVLSLIDNSPRIRTRFLEASDMGSSDKRFIRKGRSLTSIPKISLALLYGYILETNNRKDIYTKPTDVEYMSLKKDYVKPYGCSSMKKFAKYHPVAFCCFTWAMEDTVADLTKKIVKLMVEEGKYIFL